MWLISLYQNGLNGILADSMGLGKTVCADGMHTQLQELQFQLGTLSWHAYTALTHLSLTADTAWRL